MFNRRSFFAASAAAAAGARVLGADRAAASAPASASVEGKLKIRDVRILQLLGRPESKQQAIYVEVAAEEGLSGMAGPLGREQAFIIRSLFRSALIGRDPLAGEALWELLRRRDRHARSGSIMMAISALDNALWDLRGKFHKSPVYRLLGGPTRERIRAYASMLGFSVEPAEAAKLAKDYYDKGFAAQKWFFKYGPADGGEGRRKNLELVRVLRETLGEDAELLFDAHWNWDVPYAISMARDMLRFRPTWLEEPLHPEQLEGYTRLKRETGIPLAAGEHLYTRWNVKTYLDAGILDFVQTDPEWCGGITELVKICALAETYEAKVVPHGHHILAAAHVVASQNPTLCPMVEYLFQSHADRMQYFQKTRLRPEGGWLALPTEPGLGLTLDDEKIAEKRELKWD